MSEEAKFIDQLLPPGEHEAAPDATEPGTPIGMRSSSHPQIGIGKPVRARPVRKLVTTLTLSSRTCKWPIGDPTKPDFHYCGEPPQTGRVYCSMHDSMSYQPTPRRKS